MNRSTSLHPTSALGNGSSDPHPRTGAQGGSKDTLIWFGVIAVLLVAVVAAILIWGLVGLAMWALALVPVVLGLLVVTTFG